MHRNQSYSHFLVLDNDYRRYCQLKLLKSSLCTTYRVQSSKAGVVTQIDGFVSQANSQGNKNDFGDWYFSWIDSSCTQDGTAASTLIFALSVEKVHIWKLSTVEPRLNRTITPVTEEPAKLGFRYPFTWIMADFFSGRRTEQHHRIIYRELCEKGRYGGLFRG